MPALTYCLNIHRGETWAENFAAIREHALAVRDRVAAGERFGLGLRLSHQAAMKLARPEVLAEAREFFARESLSALTINGFPYGNFHATRVKESVYAPDWRTDERRDYTMLLADLLIELGEGEGSISTVPVSFKPWMRGAEDVEAAARRLIEVASNLDRLRERTGRELHLGLEPEPGCYLETIGETVRFFEEVLFATADEEIVRRHIGVCLDTCHVAVEFEEPAEAVRRLRAAGIRLSKVQLSAALRTGGDAESRTALERFCEPVYLHQVMARRADGTLDFYLDLPEALASAEAYEEMRVHFHVPLFWKGDAVLGSTVSTMTPEFFREAAASGVEHFEIETYTYDVLPPELRAGGVVDSIVREFDWAREAIIRMG